MARGIASRADVLTLGDGTDLNQIWNEFQATLEVANNQRGALIDLLTFRTTNRSDTVLQSPSGTAEFEDASEYGVPSAGRAEAATITLGYDFRWKDFATRYTWQYLADASAEQVASLHNGALAADSRLQYRTVLRALFNNGNRTSPETDATIYALWNADGTPIPEHNGDTFDPNTHTHYLTTGTATLTDPKDVEDLQNTVLHHGYGEDDGATLVLLCNRQEGDIVAGWRAGVGGASFDFIPSDTSVPYLTTEALVGQRPPGQFQGLKISGQYGHALIAPTSLIPAGYMAVVAVGGPTPVIDLREHARFGGLRLIRGNQPDYPLVSAYYVHGVGAGVRQRGAAAVIQVTAGAYTPPTF
ncbi:MAG: hypothetical protein M3P83_08375 [Actinomycetota bacterium]|nr:hypothetical protein [Actinomycetota bacterium]